MSDEADPLTTALSSRRIPHSRSQPKGKGKRSSHGTTNRFDPLRALGHYEVQLGSNAKRARKSNDTSPESSSWFEIHELTPHEDGLIGTFRFCVRDGNRGRVEGMCILAGSRKGLAGIVEDLERDDDEGSEDGEDEDEEDSHSDSEEEPSSLEASDAKLNQRYEAFEKNTFRNPKFWFRWKGHVVQAAGEVSQPPSTTDTQDNSGQAQSPATESDVGYVVFANNSCDKFEGTVSCSLLGWDNVKMSGWKTRSRGTPCPTTWIDF